MNKALIIVDIQNDYFENGRQELEHTKEAAENAAKLLERFRKNRDYIVFIQHISMTKQATFFLPDTDGCEISNIVKPLKNEVVLIKSVPNSFYKTGLNQLLMHHEIEELVVCGMMSHMCIDTTVRAAKDYGYKVTLIEDACTTLALDYKGETISADTVHKTMMAALNGTFAKIVTTEEYLGK